VSEVGVHGSAGPARSKEIDFRVLGPVEAQQNGRLIALGGPRQRTLLALLLLRPGRVVPTDELVDAIWAGEPPEGAGITIRSYVSRLRSALGDPATVFASASGYSLHVDTESIDAAVFDRLVRAADDDLSRGNARAAADRLTRATSLWRGRAFGDLSDDGPLRVEAERLDELRLHAVEQRFEAALLLGQAAEVVDEIEAETTLHPYRERLWRLLMLALYHSGRQADALATFKRSRKLLDEQLGIDPSPDLQALEGQILRHEVPRVGRVGRRDNLPNPQTTFVGRTQELADVYGRLQGNRLVTLTGVGGVGKTRLAVELARHAGDLAADGVVFVDLAPLAETADVASEIARTLELREQATASATDLVATELRNARTILVLDNCEHVRNSAADVADVIRAHCRDVRIVATSRMPLGAQGEIEVPVAPMGVPGEHATPDEVRASESVKLLVERVAASRPRGVEDDEALAEAARICRDLDGLPLAIELAAARAKAMSLTEIAGRLDDRFRFLVSWRRMAAARHQTLKQAIDWSYDLLSADDQRVFAGLAAFAGGFTLDAVAAVCVENDEMAALDATTRLVDASLVVAEPREGETSTRYRMLETVRQYAAEKLHESGRVDTVRTAHTEFFRALAERAEPELTGAGQAAWFARLDDEHANFVAALDHLARLAHASADEASLLEFTVALTRFWYVRGHLSEARDALGRALASSAHAPTPLRRRALTAAASIALLQGDYREATRYAEASLEAARETGEERLVANGLSNLGAIVLASGDDARARVLLEEAVARARTVDDTRILALALNNLGDHALTVGEYEQAEPLFAESLDLLEKRGDTANIARSLFNLGAVALMTGRLDDAADRLRGSLRRSEDAGDKEDLAWSLLGLASLAAARDESDRAAVLLGAATSLLTGMGADFKPFERKLHDETAGRVAVQMGDAAFQQALARGRAMPLVEVIEVTTAA
jgi:predicted ATPase/DNA-binding SARP family transcriptional activator